MNESEAQELNETIGFHMNAITRRIDELCGQDEKEKLKWYKEVESWITGTIKNTFGE